MRAGIFFGGGAFIALHAGYSKGPLARVQFDRVYGVSAGSLWATILGFCGAEKGLEILGTIQKTSDIFAGKDFLAGVGDLLGRRWASLPPPAPSFSYKPLRALLSKYISGKPTIPVDVSRVNLETGRHQHVTAYPDGTFATDADDLFPVNTLDDFQDAVLSSCLTYPLVDAFVDNKNQGWIDGGFREGGPVAKAIYDRMDELHICLTGLYTEDCGFTGNANDPFSGITRCEEIMANQNVVSAVNLSLDQRNSDAVFIYQALGAGSSQDFNQADIQKNIAIGACIKPVPAAQVKELD